MLILFTDLVVGNSDASYVATFYDSRWIAYAQGVNFCIVQDPGTVDASAVDDVEKPGLVRSERFGTTGSAYALEHATRTATIGLVLSSSPIALLAWYVLAWRWYSAVYLLIYCFT